MRLVELLDAHTLAVLRADIRLETVSVAAPFTDAEITGVVRRVGVAQGRQMLCLAARTHTDLDRIHFAISAGERERAAGRPCPCGRSARR